MRSSANSWTFQGGVGCLVLLRLGFAHMKGRLDTISPEAFRAIGFFCLANLVFVLLVLLVWVRNDVLTVRRRLARMKHDGS